jgi:hypothetical protein
MPILGCWTLIVTGSVFGEQVKGTGHKRYGHHLGGGQPDLGVVVMADGLQELVAQVSR